MTHQGLSADTQAMMAFESQKKSTGVAYLLLIFLGALGAHRFYLGRTGSAVAQLLLFIFGWVLAVVVIGFFLLAALGIWILVDLFLIPSIATEQNQLLMNRLQGAAVGAAQPRTTTVDELTKFAALRDSGAITAEEYEFEKRRLLGAAAPVVQAG